MNMKNDALNNHGIRSGLPSMTSASRTGRVVMKLVSSEPNVSALQNASWTSERVRDTGATTVDGAALLRQVCDACDTCDRYENFAEIASSAISSKLIS